MHHALYKAMAHHEASNDPMMNKRLTFSSAVLILVVTGINSVSCQNSKLTDSTDSCDSVSCHTTCRTPGSGVCDTSSHNGRRCGAVMRCRTGIGSSCSNGGRNICIVHGCVALIAAAAVWVVWSTSEWLPVTRLPEY